MVPLGQQPTLVESSTSTLGISNSGQQYQQQLPGFGSFGNSQVVRYQVNGLDVQMSPAKPRELEWSPPMGAGVALAPFSPASSASTMDVRAVQCGRTTTPLAPPTSQAALVAGTNPLLLALQQNVKAPYLDPTEPDSWT